MRASSEAQTPIVPRGILKRNPKPHRTWRIRVQERAVLMRRHPPSDLRLFADNHALQHPRVFEPHRSRYLPMQRCEGRSAERRAQFVQVMPYLVDGAVLGLRQFSGGGGEGVLFEEEAHFVAAREEVVVADVRVFFSGREFRHGVVGEGERGEHLVRFGKEGGDGAAGEGIGDE